MWIVVRICCYVRHATRFAELRLRPVMVVSARSRVSPPQCPGDLPSGINPDDKGQGSPCYQVQWLGLGGGRGGGGVTETQIIAKLGEIGAKPVCQIVHDKYVPCSFVKDVS